MAKLALILTLFTAVVSFTQARVSLDLNGDDSILDPSESEYVTVVEVYLTDKEITVPETEPLVEKKEVKEERRFSAVYRDLSFPMYGRDAAERRCKQYLLRNPHHRCHHLHHHSYLHQFDAQRPGLKIKLREEAEKEKMSGQDSTEVRLGHGGGDRFAPSWWVELRVDLQHDRGLYRRHQQDLDEEKMLKKRPLRHGRREEGGGLVKRIEKFLHKFDF